MAKIEDNLKKVHAAVIAQRLIDGQSAFGRALNEAAVKAIIGGINSPAWKSYMAIFADNQEQLDRLTIEKPEEEGPGHPREYLPQLRAYMVSNAVCDVSTNGHTNNRVGPKIDGMADTNDPPVSDAEDDPGDVIKNLRPAALRSIPRVKFPAS